MFLKPDKLQNHSNEGKGKKKKKERGEGKEEKRKKRWLRSLVFIMATLQISRFQKSGWTYMFTNLPTSLFKFCF